MGYLKKGHKVLGLKGSTRELLDHDIVVKAFRGYPTGTIIPAGTPLSQIVAKEFDAETPKLVITTVAQPAAGGTVLGGGEYEYGDIARLEAIANSGFMFSKWSDGLTANPRNIEVVTAATYTAEFVQSLFKITATAGANGSITPSGEVSVSRGSTQTFRFDPDDGYKVASVTVDGSVLADQPTNYTFSSVTSDHTIAVTFDEIPVTEVNVTTQVSPASKGTITPGGSKTIGDVFRITVTPEAGYRLAKWKKDDIDQTETSNTFTLIVPNVACTITAVLEEIPTYTITASSRSIKGTALPASQTVIEGGTARVDASCDAGYRLKKWYLDGAEQTETSNTFTLTNVTAAHLIEVDFEEIPVTTYTITASSRSDKGVLTPATQTVAEGSTVEVHASYASEYRLKA